MPWMPDVVTGFIQQDTVIRSVNGVSHGELAAVR